ncbi:MAG: crossover junction endodeoxyribonuclease RuvC [Planctomycetes bacterium]|nr:crossover junction endodeoxyribonuclease RuvC [Planctomycetota bacterium]
MTILGLDPGIARCGFGVVQEERGRRQMVAVGCLTTPAGQPTPLRLQQLGDQLVEVTVWTPTNLSGEERLILEELERLHQHRARSEGRGFFEKMREILRD